MGCSSVTVWVLTGGVLVGLVALVAAAVLVCLVQQDETRRHLPRWVLPGLSILAFGGMILYGGALLGSLYIGFTRVISVMALQ